MKKDLLLQLLNEIKKSNTLLSSIKEIFVTEDKNCLEILFTLTDEQINNILSFESDKLKVFQIYMYLNKEGIPNEICTMLNCALMRKNENVYYTIPILQDKSLLNRKEISFIIDAILIGDSFSVEKAAKLVLDHNINEHSKGLEIIRLVARCKQLYQANYTANAASNLDLLNREDVLDFLYVIAHANHHYHAQNAYYVAINKDVLKKDNAISFVRLIASIKEHKKCDYATEVATNPEVLGKNNALEYVKSVANAKTGQEEYVASAATDLAILKREDSLKIVKKIGQASGLYQAKVALQVARSFELSSRKDLLKIVRIIANAVSEKQAQYAGFAAMNNVLSPKENMPDYIKLIANAEKSDNAHHAYNTVSKPDVLRNVNSLEVIEMIANAKHEYQAYFIGETASNKALLKKADYLEILKVISSAIGGNQASVASDIAVDSLFQSLNNLLEYVKMFANTEDRGQLYCAYNICADILISNEEVFKQKGIECAKLLLSVDGKVLIKCENRIDINDKMTYEDVLEQISKAIDDAKQQIEKEEQEIYQNVNLGTLLKDNDIDSLIKCVSNVEQEDITPETIVKVKIKG